MITIKNKSRTAFVLNMLPGVDYGHADLKPAKHELTREVTLADGTMGQQVQQRELPASITWLPGEEKDGLPNEVAEIPEFQRAVAAGVLVISKGAASIRPAAVTPNPKDM